MLNPPTSSRTFGGGRHPALLPQSYVLDRYCSAVISVVALLVPTFVVFKANPLLEHPMLGVDPQDFAGNDTWATPEGIRLLQERVLHGRPYAADAPTYEQFLQMAWAYLSWEPLAIVLLGSGILAIALQWRGSNRRSSAPN